MFELFHTGCFSQAGLLYVHAQTSDTIALEMDLALIAPVYSALLGFAIRPIRWVSLRVSACVDHDIG